MVWGFIGLTVMNPLIQQVFHAPVGLNVLNGGLLLALMSVPIMVCIGEDALKAVPDSYREAALALGATRWQTVYRVLLPAAKNGLLAAVLLGVGRAVGETMAVLMATGHAVNIPTQRRSTRCARSPPPSPPSWARPPVGSRPLSGAVPHRHPAVLDHLRRQPDRRPDRARHSRKHDAAMKTDARPSRRSSRRPPFVRKKQRRERVAQLRLRRDGAGDGRAAGR